MNDFPNPIREKRLNWDVRHQLIFQGTLAAGKGQHPSVFGLRLPDNWNITVLSRFGSGSPFTEFTTDPAEFQVTENAATGNYTTVTDLKITKTFDVFNTQFSLFADVFNLFNQNSILVDNPYYRWFNTETGQPYRYGDTLEGTNQFYDWYTMVRLRDPRQLAAPRQINLGLRIDW